MKTADPSFQGWRLPFSQRGLKTGLGALWARFSSEPDAGGWWTTLRGTLMAERFSSFVAIWISISRKQSGSVFTCSKDHIYRHSCKYHTFLPIREVLEWPPRQKKELGRDGNKQPINAQSAECPNSVVWEVPTVPFLFPAPPRLERLIPPVFIRYLLCARRWGLKVLKTQSS